MKKHLINKSIGLLIILISLTAVYSQANAQCLSFAKNSCKPKLGDFVHDGNYNATILGAGETAELYKTFFKGHKYRIVVGKVDNLPKIHFRLIDENNNIIFDNKEHQYTDVWDFEVESTQMLIIKLKVLDDYENKDDNTTKGCISVLFGIQKDKN